jgi:effector-binding domain-containing protein
LLRVEARLRQIESEDRASDYDVVVKELEPLRVATRQADVESFGAPIGPVLGRLSREVLDELRGSGVEPAGPWMALYEDSGDDHVPITVIAAIPIACDARLPESVAVRELRDVAKAATTIHRGTMACIDDGYQALVRWAEATGERVDGYSREVYHDCTGDQSTWVTELQFRLEPPEA